MLLSTTTDYLERKFGMKKAIDIIADSGYDAIDLSVFTDEHCTDVHDIEYYKEIRNYAGNKGLVFNQSHAPFPTSVPEDSINEIIFKKVTTAMRNAACLGVKNIIVHPMQHLKYSEDNNAEKLFEMNMNFYRRLIPYCEEYGIHVALENMYQNQRDGWHKCVHSTCSRPDEFIKYLDTLNSEWMVGCLDLGHVSLVSEDVTDFITKLGNKRLKALHVHDVDGASDWHTLPFFGITDWDKVAKALADIGYEGDFTFEADYFFNLKPTELYPACAKFMAETGRYIVNQIQKYR